mmetsp:Transcript_24071/g.58495  ORF Transcript_24071/g.58495 Transcript_24071/m.58495 type:complete len:741 (+) Transcript_24071:120-2342(+)
MVARFLLAVAVLAGAYRGHHRRHAALVGGVCPTGMVKNDDGTCEDFGCPEGHELVEGGYCKSTEKCPAGFIMDPYGGFCVARECPKYMAPHPSGRCSCEHLGTVTAGHGVDFWCAGVGCPPGTLKNNDGLCEDKPCPTGYYRSWTGWCELKVCPLGFERDIHGFCQEKQCGQAEVLNDHGDCVPALRAGSGRMFDGDTMPKVSTTMWCLLILATTYFSVFTTRFLLRTLNSDYLMKGAFAGAEACLSASITYVMMAPMLGILFLCTRMRAIQLAQGQTEVFGLPQPYVKTAMAFATVCFVVQVILAILIPACTNKKRDAETGEEVPDKSGMDGLLRGLLLLFMVIMYIAVVVVCVGLALMDRHNGIGDRLWNGRPPPLSPAIFCTFILTFFFFAIYGCWAIFHVNRYMTEPEAPTKMEEVFTAGRLAVGVAPILCVLFVAASMRSNQLDRDGRIQPWAEIAMYVATAAVIVQTVVVIGLPLNYADSQPVEGIIEGDVEFVGIPDDAWYITAVFRYVLMGIMYAAGAVVIASIFFLTAQSGPTPNISPAVVCVICLVIYYFVVTFLLFVFQTLRRANNSEDAMGRTLLRATVAMGAAYQAVLFAPMLAILFIACRMRALQLSTREDGTVPPGAGPQCWAQEAMYLATWSVLAQIGLDVVMALVLPLKADKDITRSNAFDSDRSPAVYVVLSLLRTIAMFCMLGCAIAIIVAVFVMKPENLPPWAKEECLVPGFRIVPPIVQ